MRNISQFLLLGVGFGQAAWTKTDMAQFVASMQVISKPTENRTAFMFAIPVISASYITATPRVVSTPITSTWGPRLITGEINE